MSPRLRPRPGTAAARAAVALVVTAAMLALAGCVSIPTSGPIRTGDVVSTEQPGVPLQLPSDPVVDAEPAELVRGFLLAGAAGLADEFVVARKFLTARASDEWDPRAHVTVYPQRSSGPQVEPQEDGTVVVTVPVEATVDEAGRYAEAAPGALDTELVFELARDTSGQWRISALPDGVLMDAGNFEVSYRAVPVYFASQDRTHLVPDLRWFATAKTPTLAASALLWGPSPWLRDAVVSGAPEGARLSTETVTVSEDGVARVDLAEIPTLPEQVDRNLLHAQLTETLRRIPVTGVEVTVGGLPWRETSVPVLQRDVAPTSGPYMLVGDTLSVLRDGVVEPLEDVADLTGLDPRHPAIGPDESIRVVLSGTGRLLLLPPGGGAPQQLLTGATLVPPSVDRHGWVWTGERASDGTLLAVDAAGDVAPVDAPWLEGRTVRSLRVSRDGARIAVVSAGTAATDVEITVTSVVRDEDGRPTLASPEPLAVGGAIQDALEVAWVDEVTLAVLGTSAELGVPTTHVVPVGGPTVALTLLEGRGIAAGRGRQAIYVVDEAGTLLARQGNQWKNVADGVRDPVFPG
ncbi:GerMN domain-containing protein [Actinotalea ferrariae]|uniref:LpqB family beta-propeller domain-containing protein n=1 Tax=Actinotalea ferrariae TaxID=1386098 RepID=UPI001C8BE411|nr:LpqB family beta-propeller domain-containing protein [Actinotalea ferrariae]MBX9247028.1 GerMN domain-containing protein [Actinotalea ferrariae]